MKKNTDKNSNPNTSKSPSAKITRDPIKKVSPWLEDYKDFFTHRMHPVTEAFLERIGSELIEYAQTTDTYRLEWFFTQKKIFPTTARAWAHKYESFGAVYKLAKQIIGMRREEGALKKKLDAGIVMHTMSHYDDDWKEIAEWKAKLRSEHEAQQTPTTVIFKSFE